MTTIKSFTSLEQSQLLAEILPIESADMYYFLDPTPAGNIYHLVVQQIAFGVRTREPEYDKGDIPCWSLAALLKLIPKHILRKDKIHYEQTFIPSFRWEITPTAIYYTDGNNIMDYVSFRYGKNNIELIDAVFKMVVWLKENNWL